MLVSISTLILYNKNVGSFTIRLPFSLIAASHVLFTLFGGFFLSASKISSTLLFFFVGSIAFSVFSSIVTFLPWLLLWQRYKKYKNREQLPCFFVRFSSAPNDFSISCKRFFVLLRMIFSSAQGDLRIKRRCQTIRTFYHSLGLAAVFGLSSTDYIEMGQMLMAL